MIRKKASLTAKQIVMLVLAIVGFGIGIVVLLSLSLGGDTDRKVCHLSVIERMTLPDYLASTKDIAPLKCKTRKVCISDNFVLRKGDCEEFRGESYETARISGTLDEKKKQIKMIEAREIADCKIMMGEGEGQIFSRTWDKQTTCSNCVRIAFDTSLKSQISEIGGLAEYMFTHAVPGREESFWDLSMSGLSIEGYNSSLDKHSTEEKVVTFAEIGEGKFEAWTGGIIGGGVGGGGGALIGAKIGGGIGAFGGPLSAIGLGIAGGIVGFVGGAVLGGYGGHSAGQEIQNAWTGNEKYLSGVVFVDYDEETLGQLNCDEFKNIA